MLIHGGLNTHSNRISVKKLKEDGKNSTQVILKSRITYRIILHMRKLLLT
ncbi:hypothetical protein [Sulfolobus spindle-shaped virus]|nr:hypothetical protein [Sulfolobus spindle-shaped virus]